MDMRRLTILETYSNEVLTYQRISDLRIEGFGDGGES